MNIRLCVTICALATQQHHRHDRTSRLTLDQCHILNIRALALQSQCCQRRKAAGAGLSSSSCQCRRSSTSAAAWRTAGAARFLVPSRSSCLRIFSCLLVSSCLLVVASSRRRIFVWVVSSVFSFVLSSRPLPLVLWSSPHLCSSRPSLVLFLSSPPLIFSAPLLYQRRMENINASTHQRIHFLKNYPPPPGTGTKTRRRMARALWPTQTARCSPGTPNQHAGLGVLHERVC